MRGRALPKAFRANVSPVFIHGAIERRNVDALDLRKPLQKRRFVQTLALCGADGLDEFAVHFFPVAQKDRVEQVGDRFRVAGARTARHDQRVRFIAIGGKKRNARKLQHRQHVRVAHFVQKRESDDVKVRKRRFGFERKEPFPRFREPALHIGPGRIAAFAVNAFHRVQNVIQDPASLMRHADLVHVGKAQRKAEVKRLLADHIPLVADVPRGLFDTAQQLVQNDRIQRFFPHPIRTAYYN